MDPLPQLYATLWLLVVIAISGVSSFSLIPPNNNQHQHQQQKPQPLPITDNSYTILGLDYLSPPKDFALVQRAYRNLARQYHPDVVVGPDRQKKNETKQTWTLCVSMRRMRISNQERMKQRLKL